MSGHDESAFFTSEQGGAGDAQFGTEGFSGPSGGGEPSHQGPRSHAPTGSVGGGAFGSEGRSDSRIPAAQSAAGVQGGGRVPSQGAQSAAGSGNLGLARKSGHKRVVGTTNSLVSLGVNGLRDLKRSYTVSDTLQFNEVEELQADAISRDFAQELMEKVFESWGLDTRDPKVMRKAEDVIFAFVTVRGASPYADYSLAVMVGGVEVDLKVLSDVLSSYEVQRRRFARAIADDLRDFIRHEDNVILRDRIRTKLGVTFQYVHLAFDGSTHCTKMNRNETAFTKALESRNLFDDETVKGSLKGSSLLDGTLTAR